jgi:TIR domain
MAHDVFISHALKDKNFATTICEKLESSQVKCWIAGRDISAGDEWSEAIRKAIGSSLVVVLVLSENANAATHMEREIAHAYYAKRVILPVRLTATPPRREFLFYLGNVRWFEAFNAPIEQHLGALIATVRGIVQGQTFTRDALPSNKATAMGKELGFRDLRLSSFQGSGNRGLQIVKRVSVAFILFSALLLSWFLYSRWKGDELSPEVNRHPTKSASGARPELAGGAAASASPSKPAYAYTRLGLWVSSSATPTPLVQDGSRAASTPSVSEAASPSLSPDVDHETKSSRADETSDVKSAQETSPTISDQPVPVAEAASPTEKNEPGGEESAPDKRPAATPSGTPLVRPAVEAAPSVDSDQRFFSWRVNFYGKGVLSLPEARASMARYRQEWPMRNWTPRGEPEFPKLLHSIHPELYEVLQPFDWTVANGSQHKNGSATLYVRIRKDDKGQFHIIHLEQRRPEDQPENTPD